jgi:beta-N-acetylhexosaminidase
MLNVYMIKFLGIIALILGFIILPQLPERHSSSRDNDSWSEPAVLEMMAEIYADSVLATLTLDEKIAQLIMLDVYPKKDENYYRTIDRWVKEKKVGGIIFFRGEPAEIAKLSKRFSAIASVPLWIGMDAEWGISMRVDSIRRLPYAMTLGAITDNYIVREYGFLVAQQCRRLGVNMNMGPVADVNNNPRNPVINYRSFGENPRNVSLKAIAYYLGMNDAGVISVAKHFPGHGNTDTDSHIELPVVYDTKQLIDSVHLLPFKELIRYGIPAIMCAHLYVPAFDSRENMASSLSSVMLNGLLIDQLNFTGIVMTDALGMQGVSKYNKPGQTEVRALLAGNDILLMPENPQIAIDSIKRAIQDGRMKEEIINEKCRKLLKFKYIYLNNPSQIDKFDGIPAELNNQDVSDFIFRVYSNAMTLVYNNDSVLPFNELSDSTVAVVTIGKQTETDFIRTLKQYYPVRQIIVSGAPGEMEIHRTISSIQEFKKVIICVYGMNNSAAKRYGINESCSRLIQRISEVKKSITILFGNPYGLNFLVNPKTSSSLIVAYEENEEAERAVALGIAGLLPFKGRLPVTAGGFSHGTGIVQHSESVLQIVDPADLNLNLDALLAIDTIAQMAIDAGTTPGCQIVLAQWGKVFYYKSFGFHTYEKKVPVRNSDLYDLASLTKILATTVAIMKLFEEEKLLLSDQIEKHLPWTQHSPVGKLNISEIMAHQSGLVSWIPFYKKTIENDSLRSLYFSKTKTDEFNISVADNMWMLQSYRDTIFNRILDTKLLRKRYRYSDLGFILLKELVEEITGESFEQYLDRCFYKPMQLGTMTFNPLKKFPKERIIPTEDDTTFRKQLIHGYVHDQAASMLGGISGHAGLFGNAMDVAAMMQMFMDHGRYAGKIYLDSLVLSKFTAKQYPNNRRGLGFDKPAQVKSKGNSCDEASELSFGHTGFSGTYAWADPENGLVVVFLSNRIHPDAENRLLNTLDVRVKIQHYAYKAIHVQ